MPRPHETCTSLVKMTHSGICGTDYKIYSGAIPVGYPRVMGHEMAGESRRRRRRAARSAATRVIVDPELYCGACFHCRIGQTHLCPDGMLIGRDTNGGFADYVGAPAEPRVSACRTRSTAATRRSSRC